MPVTVQGGADKLHVLVTGGAGYIGSHTVLELLQSGYKVSVIDNLSNSTEESLRRVSQLTSSKVHFYEGDLLDCAFLESVFARQPIWAVIHFAALKSAPESVHKPLDYYRVNVAGTINLLTTMSRHGVHRLVFSSTAAVYGTPEMNTTLIPETHATSPANPYGRSKLMVENIIRDMCEAHKPLAGVILRYFNPVGAHESGMIGEDPKGGPGNLMPFVLQVMTGERSHLEITGVDWPTCDGSGVRDFIHVVDLARGHVEALRHANVLSCEGGAWDIINMGTGCGTSVLQMVNAMEKSTGLSIPVRNAPRRDGDVAEVVADPARAHEVLRWKAIMNLEDMCRDAWTWRLQNPQGYDTAQSSSEDPSKRLIRRSSNKNKNLHA
ncbi:UDP-glucose 4-epimerase [Spizellomyces sp. 'palustris']|nr:UDP-glucose 4-epimerase [Spizellomyces sp. 'palustris']